MDDHNVHHFWGVSPALDLVALASPSSAMGKSEPLMLLQVAPCDARHTLTTLSRVGRHLQQHAGLVHMYVYEEEPEGLARHLLLLSVMLDGSLPARERVEVLLELHGNALLRENTAAYLDQRGRALEGLMVSLASGAGADSAELAGQLSSDLACLASVIDATSLKFQERDAIIEALHKYRSQVDYDMVKAWEARCRKWYGDRYDFKRNMIDWDYHMRLLTAGTPGQDAALGSIVHFHHFRHWRAHGVAYELRGSAYGHPNRSLLSTAYGRTKEFKDRSLKDVGRSVSAWGFWGDLLNSPYHAFGSACEEPSFFASSNKQFSRTAVDVAEHNVAALLHELRSGQPYLLPTGGEAPRAKVARGPTSMEDLQDEAGKDAQQQQQQQEEVSNQKVGLPSVSEEEEEVERKASEELDLDTSDPTKPPVPGHQQAATSAATQFIPSPEFQGCRPGYLFSSGPEGQGYYPDSKQPQPGPPPASEASPNDPGPTATSAPVRFDRSTAEMESEGACLRAAEAEADSAAWARVSSRLRLHLVTGDLAKSLTGRAKMQGVFDVVSLGCRHVHLAGPEYMLHKASKPSGVLAVETARYLLQLNKEQVAAFEAKIKEIAGASGWAPHVPSADEVHVMFEKQSV